MGRHNKYTDRQFLMAILGGYPDPSGRTDDKGKPIIVPGSGGIITTIAVRLGCDWHTANIYCRDDKSHPALVQAISDEENRILDGAQSVIVKSIMGGNTDDAKWYLSKKGKDRGFGTDEEQTKYHEVRIIVERSDGDKKPNVDSNSTSAKATQKAKSNKAKQGKA